MRVFIDTVSYKRLFEASPSDVYFNRLVNLAVKEKKFTVVFPQITRVEAYREIEDSLNQDTKDLTIRPPTLKPINDDGTKKTIKQLRKEFSNTLGSERKRIGVVKKHLLKKQQMASVLFTTYLNKTLKFPNEDKLVSRAKKRIEKNYPPGKAKAHSVGDELAWEILLENCTDDDLTIVSYDDDFRDTLNRASDVVNPFLLEEWRTKSSCNLELVRTLGDLFKIFEKQYEKPKKEIEKEEQEGTIALRPTFYPPVSSVTFTATPFTSLASTTSFPSMSSSASASTTSTSTSGVEWGTPSASWSVMTCWKCGDQIDINGPYVVSNGTTFHIKCFNT